MKRVFAHDIKKSLLLSLEKFPIQETDKFEYNKRCQLFKSKFLYIVAESFVAFS